VGVTLIEGGGHNPLEPAAMGLPVYVGPNHWNFAEITELLANAGGLQCVAGADDLAHVLIAKWNNNHAYQQASTAALSVVKQNRGALSKQFLLINSLIKASAL
ncbi:3-deoxy-D-manno-octulosonic acid transferase, partial [Shewanella sp.]|uniref:3-deoxy-D-manno-octulosonic acid transferase n=1 Tax=Shewanella sp. TaxID=50422 RepID=UPI0040483F3F